MLNTMHKEKEAITMANRGWMINLTGSSIQIYSQGTTPTKKVGTLTKNECFAEGSEFGASWEGWGMPVFFLNASHSNTFGMIATTETGLVDFADYASNGSSWVKVNTLKRKVQYATVAYYADGSKCCDLPAGSYVWLTQACTRGQRHPNYIAVTSVCPVGGTTRNFEGNGFIDLTYGNRWVNVGSILLRQA